MDSKLLMSRILANAPESREINIIKARLPFLKLKDEDGEY